VRISGIDLNRFAAVHPAGDIPKSGHYTATVATKTTAYSCDDSTIVARPGLCDAAWSNAYLIFLRTGDAALCGGQHPALRTVVSSEESPAQKENLAASIAGSADACAENCAKGAGDPSTEPADTHKTKKMSREMAKTTRTRTRALLKTTGNAPCNRLSASSPPLDMTTGYAEALSSRIFLREAYMMRVRRLRKPVRASADYTELLFFDAHYALSALCCQQLGYANRVAIPRLVGSMCPPERENEGEPHAAYKLMLFSRSRCPGPGACADPLVFRPLLLPSDKPHDPQIAMGKPKFAPSWKACKCELELHANVASGKEKRAQKIAVLADATTMKDCSSDPHPAVRSTFRLRPHLLKILATCFDKRAEQMPHGIVKLVERIAGFVCGRSCYDLDEQLHLGEFATLMNDAMDMDLLARQKPFRDEKQGGVINDVDSKDEPEKANARRTEILGGAGESECSEVEDTDGDPRVRRQA
jgi:hypothetical protein